MVPMELHDSIQDRQSDMQDAMVSGILQMLLELTSMQSKAAEKLAEITEGLVP